MNKQSIKLTAAVLILLFAFGAIAPTLNFNKREFVTYDFFAFHTGFQLYQAGELPYDWDKVSKLQETLPYQWDLTPVRSWNPPWTFAMLYPFFQFSMETAATIWFLFSLTLMFASSVLLWKTFLPHNQRYSIAMIWGAFMYANIDCLQWNQFGLFLTFCCSLFLWAQQKEDYVLAGLALVPLSIKPHLFFIFGITYLIWAYRNRMFQSIKVAAATLVGLSVYNELKIPGILSSWLASSQDSPIFIVTPSITGVIRRTITALSGEIPSWPVYTIPLIVLALWLYFLKQRNWEIDWKEILPLSLVVGLIGSPYSNFHDQTLMVTAQLFLVALSFSDKYSQSRRYQLLAALAALQCISLGLNVAGFNHSWKQFWVPTAMLLVWVRFRPIKAK